MILGWSINTPLSDVQLQWKGNRPEFKIQWRGPNLISTQYLKSQELITEGHLQELVETKIAVITGPKGEKGDKGDSGTGGTGGDLTFSWSPPSAQAVWVVSHPLNKFPSVTVVDSTGRLVMPEITYLNTSLVEITFAYATSGTAYLN